MKLPMAARGNMWKTPMLGKSADGEVNSSMSDDEFFILRIEYPRYRGKKQQIVRAHLPFYVTEIVEVEDD